MAKRIASVEKTDLPSVGFVALGCAKNTVDLQVMAGHLLKCGCKLAPSPDMADVVIVNTCAFIEQAREEAVREIERACALKREGKCKAVIGAGCFIQRYKGDLRKLFPEVDAFIGIDAIDRIASLVREVMVSRRQKMLVPPGQARKVFDPPVAALRFSGQAFAYLKIAEGCAHRCAYCAIPGIRGGYRSRDPMAILKEAEELIKTGVRELDIIAQDPMLYGVDLNRGKKRGERITLTDLLLAIDGIEGDFWVRVLYSYPSEITDEYLNWMNTSRHAVRYVDVPLQHTSAEVLKRMARGSAVNATLDAARMLRERVPGVTLRTTVMTGFPGETERRFEKMLADLGEMKFDHLGAFSFSPEEGTAAFDMKGRPSKRVAEAREAAVMAQQKKIWRTKAKKAVGRVFKALVVAPGVARLESQAPEVDGVTYLFTDGSLSEQNLDEKVGSFVGVKLEKALGYDFAATVVSAGLEEGFSRS